MHIKYATDEAMKLRSRNPVLYYWLILLEWENLLRRNIHGRMSWFNKCMTNSILYVAIIVLRLLSIRIHKDFGQMNFDTDSKHDLARSREML